ncbi:MAG: Light-sensor Protein kinase [Cirrosporium novae-zelandiae]|nr:MAG: Light-sensor Protein kinase [Cirrosporium novae-zelandiae]
MSEHFPDPPAGDNTEPTFSHPITTNQNVDAQPSPHEPSVSSIPSSPRLPASGTRPSAFDRGSIISTSSMPMESPLSSPGLQNRVFPIRSVVSVDPTPGSLDTSGYGFPNMGPSRVSQPPTEYYTRSRQYSQASFTSSYRQSPVPQTPLERTDVTSSRQYPLDTLDSTAGPSRSSSRAFYRGNSRKRERRSSSHLVDANLLFSGEDDLSLKSDSTASSVQGTASKGGSQFAGDLENPRLVTTRFKHVITDGGHAVVTGRDGDILQRCEDEPICIPGAIQSFGFLIAFDEDVDRKLVIRIVSENSKQLIGYSPAQLFALDSFCDILSEEQVDNLLDHIDFVREDDTIDTAESGPEIFTLSIRTPHKRSQKLWCALHANDKNPDLIICEFELEDDKDNPLVPMGVTTPELVENTLGSDPTAEELAESTINISRPLRVLRSARKKKGDAAAMEVFNVISQVQEQLANAANLEIFLKVLVGVIKELTGFHRVMIYRFDQAWNGKVVTELVDRRATMDLYKGLHFPASDIPKQARELYKINKVRLLYDRDQETSRLVCRTIDDLDPPLDMTHCFLRAMSPIHIKYLSNMAVRSSMSISINAFNELWGLISCHSYGPRGMRVSFPIRKMCRLVGDSASRNIERLSYASRLQARKLINTVPTERNPSGYIIASSEDLLKLFDADCGMLSIRDETKILGKIGNSQEALAMLEYLRVRKFLSVMSSQDVRVDFPDLRYLPGFRVIAGLLLVPLSAGGQDFIVFFRQSQPREVKWAGNPYEKVIKEGTEAYLEPRKSFRIWSEKLQGKCKGWTEEQVETAAVLCLVYGKFIEVWRQKEAALQSSQLTKLLLANSAHEVRTPLNAIINYLEIAMEGSLDHETRENLAKSHSASKSLIYVINDLLDLTKAEEGHSLLKVEKFDLFETIREATDPFKGDARRKNIDFEVIQHPGLPQYVLGDQRRIRQTLSNVTANAIQHTTVGGVKVEAWLAQKEGGRAEVEFAIEDSGSGMTQHKLDTLFQDLEQVTSEEDDLLDDQLMADDHRIGNTDKDGKRALGLGLAIVARFIRNTDGQLRLKSEVGKGSRFVVNLPFGLPEELELHSEKPSTWSSQFGPGEFPVTPPAAPEGEVMLVSKDSGRKNHGSPIIHMARKHSVNSLASHSSGKSHRSHSTGRSIRSDVDRLIDAIKEPYMVQELGPPLTNRDRGFKVSATYAGSPQRRPEPRRASSMDHIVPEHLRSISASRGKRHIIDLRVPLSAIKIPDEPDLKSMEMKSSSASKNTSAKGSDKGHMNVLVAEDDPINSRIVKKRLEKSGHIVHLTVNGEECARAYYNRPAPFDVVLMDMQMPIVDGLTSTKMIRLFEKSQNSQLLSRRAAYHNRVPIFAVSASLVENDRNVYVEAGFDGWILKPIDFKRADFLLAGIFDEVKRDQACYQPGSWECGGWFESRRSDIFTAHTRHSGRRMLFTKPLAQPFVDGAADDNKSTNSVYDPKRIKTTWVYDP